MNTVKVVISTFNVISSWLNFKHVHITTQRQKFADLSTDSKVIPFVFTNYCSKIGNKFKIVMIHHWQYQICIINSNFNEQFK